MAGATDGELSLYWTSRGRPVSARLAPVLAGWADLDQREEAADIGPGHPILIDPQYRLDPVLARFLSRSRFAWLAEGDQAGIREGLPAVLLVPMAARQVLARGGPGRPAGLGSLAAARLAGCGVPEICPARELQ